MKPILDPSVKLVRLSVHDKRLFPPWITEDDVLRLYVPAAMLAKCKTGDGFVCASVIGQDDSSSYVLLDKNGWHIDTIKTIMYHQEEQYLPDTSSTLLSKLPLPYNRFPIKLRNAVFGKLARKNFLRHEHDPSYFPSWPAEKSIEWLRWVCTKLNALYPLSARKWPNGSKAVLCLTHDIETREGLTRVKAMRLTEKEFSYRSAWGVIAKSYPLDHYLFDNLIKERCEIIVHGLYHDGKLPFLPENVMNQQLVDAKKKLAAWNPQGFRSPQLQRQHRMYDLIASVYSYDLSQVDTEDLPLVRPNSGCLSVFPYFRGKMPELPLTLPHDFYMMYGLGYSPRQMKKMWIDKAKLIYDIGGMMLFNLHPDSYLSGSPQMLAIYHEVLKEISHWPGVICMLPREIAAWMKKG